MLWDMTSDLTTVKVSKSVRERIARASRSQRLPANEFLDRLVGDWERRQRIAAANAAMNSANSSEREAYETESADWDSAANDGLDSQA